MSEWLVDRSAASQAGRQEERKRPEEINSRRQAGRQAEIGAIPEMRQTDRQIGCAGWGELEANLNRKKAHQHAHTDTERCIHTYRVEGEVKGVGCDRIGKNKTIYAHERTNERTRPWLCVLCHTPHGGARQREERKCPFAINDVNKTIHTYAHTHRHTHTYTRIDHRYTRIGPIHVCGRLSLSLSARVCVYLSGREQRPAFVFAPDERCGRVEQHL
mmetsp:Transcript_16948/g.48315  ORF Transcript_16948/g.48315 Transcript_16948/m.48315 type:complete len:216 (-) Transcript_16948:482-1129(-)